MKNIAMVLCAAAIGVIGPASVSFADDYRTCLSNASRDAARCKWERIDWDVTCRDQYLYELDVCRDTYHTWPRHR